MYVISGNWCFDGAAIGLPLSIYNSLATHIQIDLSVISARLIRLIIHELSRLWRNKVHNMT